MRNHRLVERVKQSLEILETEDYENDVVLPDEFLQANLRKILDSRQGLKGSVLFPPEGVTMNGCKRMAIHLRAMADEFDLYAGGIGQAEEASAMMEYEEKYRYAERDN